MIRRPARQAERLLRDVLGDAAAAEYKTAGTVTIASPGFPGVAYTVGSFRKRGILPWEYPVMVARDGRRVGDLGFFVYDPRYPAADQITALVLWLRYNERAALRMACGANPRFFKSMQVVYVPEAVDDPEPDG